MNNTLQLIILFVMGWSGIVFGYDELRNRRGRPMNKVFGVMFMFMGAFFLVLAAIAFLKELH